MKHLDKPPSKICSKRLTFMIITVFVVFAFGYFSTYLDKAVQIYTIFIEPKDQNNVTKYVSSCGGTFNSRRTGNLIYTMAAMLYVSKHTGRVPILPRHIPHGWIDNIFATYLPRFPNDFIYNKSLSIEVYERFGSFTYDKIFENVNFNATYENATTILICGYFHSLRYTIGVEEDLRVQLKFKNSTVKLVDDYLGHRTENKSMVSTIGLHVRRTDFLARNSVKRFSVVDENYINASIWYYANYFNYSDHLILFACSDDINWVKQTISKLHLEKDIPNLEVVYSIGHNSAFDMCLLSKCDGIIISTGSFSWWSAWLANTTTVYYSLYPGTNSELGLYFNRSDYYYYWVGLP